MMMIMMMARRMRTLRGATAELAVLSCLVSALTLLRTETWIGPVEAFLSTPPPPRAPPSSSHQRSFFGDSSIGTLSTASSRSRGPWTTSTAAGRHRRRHRRRSGLGPFGMSHLTAAAKSPATSDVQEDSLEVNEQLEQEEVAARTSTAPESSSLSSSSTTKLGGPNSRNNNNKTKKKTKFDLTTALFSAGLAFDSYVEPPSNSSRWEKGSKGLQVAFCSPAYTRSLYKGLLEVTPIRCTGLPEDDGGTAEQWVSGKGVDAAILVAAIEGTWKEDVTLLEREQYNQGVLDLTGAAHVGRSATAWANVDERQSRVSQRQRGRALPYHIPASWGKGGEAVWPDPEPFYLYLQDPASVRLVFTILDDNKIGDGEAVGSTHKRLVELIPQAKLSPEQVIDELKRDLLQQLQNQNVPLDALNETTKIQLGAKTWSGTLKMTSKPRKKDKNSQILAGAAAGAYVAGPVGAAAGALIGSFYEGQVQGYMQLQLRYLPIPQVPVQRKRYQVLGGMPGINWGQLYEKHVERQGMPESLSLMEDLEHCFFINHDQTGATCALYRSLEKKLLVVSFRGTCRPVDLVTDVSIVQETWVDGDDLEFDIPKVHAGFRTSLNSIARRLKELLLAAVAPGDTLALYDVVVTGHSLGGALATLFTADIAEYGVDAGRGLPQLQESDPWWKSITNTFMGKDAVDGTTAKEPPRPKSLRLYSFGSPRVGNHAFAALFDALLEEGAIDEGYRVVNGNDVVARLPRTINAIVGSVGYEHCGPTVLLTQPDEAVGDDPSRAASAGVAALLWVEGESDDRECPVRDGVALSSPLAEGSLIAELLDDTPDDDGSSDSSSSAPALLGKFMNRLASRAKTLTASDVASVLGIDKKFADRELRLIQSLLKGEALAHHMEDQYYAGMGGAAGFRARVEEAIVELDVAPP